MAFLLEGLKEAFGILFHFDQELYRIIVLSLIVTLSATGIATLFSVPLGLFMATHDFHFKKILSKVLYSFMGMPPVVLGLFVFLILARNGPLGSAQLLFTPTAMIIAQTLLIIPIITSLILNNAQEPSKAVMETCRTLGASSWETFKMLIKEVRLILFIAIIMGFSRAISEVGAVMIVGGNIKGFTRVMTTYIALNNSQGHYATSIAMGIILLVLSFIIQSISYRLVLGGRYEN